VKRIAQKSVGAFGLALVLVGAALQPASAGDAATVSSPSSPKVSAAMSQALQRDLHLTAEQAADRLAREETARGVEQRAKDALGTSYAGSWYDADSGKLIVQTTGSTEVSALKGTDSEVRRVARSSAELDVVKSGIDVLAGTHAPAAINGWHVDVKSNSVVVAVNRAKVDDAAKAFLDKAVAGRDHVRVVDEVGSPGTFADVVGGWPYYINYAARCSVGFSVYGGFVSAGHCGTPGSTVTDNANSTVIGSFAGSTFPYYDYSYVSTYGGVNLWGYVEGYNGSWYYVRGSAQVPAGSGICRSGSTTGLRCGTLDSRGWTVNYPQGTVYNLTRTNVCAEPGDSGGSWLSANQAQGVTSGGSGNCSVGGTTYYQEVNPILAAYGLTLILS